jgi:hypothetical protein
MELDDLLGQDPQLDHQRVLKRRRGGDLVLFHSEILHKGRELSICPLAQGEFLAVLIHIAAARAVNRPGQDVCSARKGGVQALHEHLAVQGEGRAFELVREADGKGEVVGSGRRRKGAAGDDHVVAVGHDNVRGLVELVGFGLRQVEIILDSAVNFRKVSLRSHAEESDSFLSRFVKAHNSSIGSAEKVTVRQPASRRG